MSGAYFLHLCKNNKMGLSKMMSVAYKCVCNGIYSVGYHEGGNF